MNILFLNNIPFNPRLGGIERVTDILVKGLKSLNSSYNFFYLYLKVDDREMLKYDFPATMLELPYEDGFNNQENVEFLLKVLREYKIDVLINQRGTLQSWDKVLGFIRDTKVVSVVHSIMDSERKAMLYRHLNLYTKSFTGYIKHFIKNVFRPIFTLFINYKSVPQLKAHYADLMKVSDALVFLSSSYVEDLKHYVEIEKDKIITSIPNPNSFLYNSADTNKKSKTVLYVGRLDSVQKAPIRLLKIWKKICYKHADWELVIVGDGPEKESMLDYIRKHHLPRVIIEGNKEDVIQYYQTASILCLVSNYEGWPMVLPEAMVNACVPICFDSFGAASEIIDNNINGYLITPFSIRKYALKLSEIMSNEKCLVKMGKSAQEKVELFSIDKIISRWDELLREIAER